MNGKLLISAMAVLMLCAPAWARDDVHHLPVSAVTDKSYAGGKLDGSVRFYFAGQQTPAVLDEFGTGVTNRKTNGVGKSDEESCKWVMLTALMVLEKAAKAKGANAVIGITSYYKKREYSDPKNYECHAGNIMSGVALRGTYARVAE